MPLGKTSVVGTSRAIEKMLKPVNASLPGGRRAPGIPPRSLVFRLTRSKIPFLIELVGIVELAGDDPPAVRKRVDEGVDERLIVETHFAARGIAGLVTLEGTETEDQPVGLRAVVVREDREIVAKDVGNRHPGRGHRLSAPTMRVTVMVSVPPVSCQSSSLPPPRGSVGLGAASGLSLFLNSTR